MQSFLPYILDVTSEFVSSYLLIMLEGLLRYLAYGVDQDLSNLLGLFQVGECNRATCPGSSYNKITAAWANIGYMTHSDFLYFLWNTSFGGWAMLLYIVGAGGALISVALNNPPKAWVWFFLGPPIYSFLIGTTQDVQGVAWRIAGQSLTMNDVWRDADTGVANTELVKRLGIEVYRDKGPSGTYPVAWMLVFLDGLFSSTSEQIISWIGMQRREGRGGSDSNLFSSETEEGPWHLLANLKWGMIENIAGASARDPDVRDALVTFLSSECGDQFKRGVHSGAYAAASQSRGSSLPATVFISESDSGASEPIGGGGGGGAIGGPRRAAENDKPRTEPYFKFEIGIDTEAIPTPRSLVRLFNSPKNQRGSFRQFSSKFSGDLAFEKGRTTEVVCSEFLFTVIQALRWEAGHAYWQLLRSFPNGFNEEQALKSLFYGWNLRAEGGQNLIDDKDSISEYTKHLVLVYLLRNELMLAPQVTETGQRFAPSEQSRGYTESYVRTQGSRSKYGELYNWAVMMPHVQGILTYLVLIGYPFAAMLMVIPGYWKAFFTWVSFFAWVKIWDVGFAIVHTLERSVWAMIGNHSAMAKVGRRLINTFNQADSKVDVGKACADPGDRLSEACSTPSVVDASNQTEDKAWFLLDQALALSGSLDLDLSNGYYIYIMAALYFAVPAVTGQLVLGAKAGMSNLATQAIGQSAGEAGGAAKSGTVGDFANKLTTNQQSLTQAAGMKGHRQSGLALQQLESANAALESDAAAGRLGLYKQAVGSAVEARQSRVNSFDSQVGLINAWGGALQNAGKVGRNSVNSVMGGSGGGQGAGLAEGAAGDMLGVLGGGGALLGAYGSVSLAGAKNRLQQGYLGDGVAAKGLSMDSDWAATRLRQGAQGFNAYSQKLGSEAGFAADTAAWEARNDFATHIAGIGGVAGMNPGNLSPGPKPNDVAGMAMTGQLGGSARDAAGYSGTRYLSNVGAATSFGAKSKGSNFVYGNWYSGTDENGAYGGYNNIGASLREASNDAPGVNAVKTWVNDYKKEQGNRNKENVDSLNTWGAAYAAETADSSSSGPQSPATPAPAATPAAKPQQ
jgi:hypothetical protein